MYTEDRAILTSVFFELEWGSGMLCAETANRRVHLEQRQLRCGRKWNLFSKGAIALSRPGYSTG